MKRLDDAGVDGVQEWRSPARKPSSSHFGQNVGHIDLLMPMSSDAT
jgi:hypothetical protein